LPPFADFNTHHWKLPIAGFVETSFPDRETTFFVAMNLLWSVSSGEKRSEMRLTREALAWATHSVESANQTWRGIFAGRDALTPEPPHRDDEALQMKVRAAIEAAHTMPDGRRGLLLFGDRKTANVVKRAPEPLISALVQEASDVTVEAFQNRHYLVAKTQGNKDGLFLCLDHRGILTVVSSQWNRGYGPVGEANQALHRCGKALLAARLEAKIRTKAKVADFALQDPHDAAAALIDLFWAEISPALEDPFVPWSGHGILPASDLDAKDVTFARGDHAHLIDLCGRLVSMGIAHGIFVTEPEGTPPRAQARGHVGYHAATPRKLAGPSIWAGSPSKTPHMLALLRRAVAAAGPVAFGADLTETRGNRRSELEWKPYRDGVLVADVLQESAHYHLEAEAKLRELMLELGISESETDTLIADVMKA
jgi:hypothetical protein